MTEAQRLIQVNRIGQFCVAGQFECVCPELPRLRDRVLKQSAADALTAKALGDGHFRDFENAGLYKNKCAAANSLAVRYCHHYLSARSKNIAHWVIELDEVLFLNFEISCNPLTVQLAKCFRVTLLKQPKCNLLVHLSASGQGYLEQGSSHIGFTSKKTLSPARLDVQYLVRSNYDVLDMDGDIELRHLRYFVAVAEELHFGRAALRLHLAQPPLSQQIRKLEDILGYPLFFRTSRAVKLTSAGEVFLERAKRTLRNVQEDMEEARSVGRGEEGFLRVGFISSAMLTPLPAMLGRYRRLYPKVNLQLHESYTSLVMQKLLKGELDAGFLRDGGYAAGLEIETLFSEPFIAVLPKRHPLAKYRTISARELRDEPFVFFTPAAGTLAYEKPVSLCEEHGFRPQVVQEAPQWLTIMRLVGAGLGVTIAPACVKQIAAPEVRCVSLRRATVESDIGLAYRTNEDRAIVAAIAMVARRSFSQRQSRSRVRGKP